jgi:hypothetical protein
LQQDIIHVGNPGRHDKFDDDFTRSKCRNTLTNWGNSTNISIGARIDTGFGASHNLQGTIWGFPDISSPSERQWTYPGEYRPREALSSSSTIRGVVSWTYRPLCL